MVVAFSEPSVVPVGEHGDSVSVDTNSGATCVSLSHTGDGVIYLSPDEAQDVALYLLRMARVVEKGSG